VPGLKRPGECFFSPKLSLWGTYSLLNFPDPDGRVKETATPTDSTRATSTPPSSRKVDCTSLQSLPIDSRPNPTSATTLSYQERSRDNQNTPMTSGRLAKSLNKTINAASSSSNERMAPLHNKARTQDEEHVNWQSPLHIAARKGHDRIVRMLLEHQGDCHEPDSSGDLPHCCTQS
jgi:hypothetical protein